MIKSKQKNNNQCGLNHNIGNANYIANNKANKQNNNTSHQQVQSVVPDCNTCCLCSDLIPFLWPFLPWPSQHQLQHQSNPHNATCQAEMDSNSLLLSLVGDFGRCLDIVRMAPHTISFCGIKVCLLLRASHSNLP